ncbi:MAG TPA: ATP-binding protein [Chthoniobacterales bacterium]
MTEKASDSPKPDGWPEFREELAKSNLQRMWWLLIASTSLGAGFALYHFWAAPKSAFVPWQVFDLGGSLIFLALIFLGRRGRLPPRARRALTPACFAFWLILMDGYYFLALPVYGETATYALGVVAPAILILLPPRGFLSLLVPNHLVFCVLLLAAGHSRHGYADALLGSLVNGTLGTIVAILAAWYRFAGTRRLFLREQELALRTQEASVAESHLRAILENIPFQAWLKDAGNVFLSVNLEFARAHGLRESDIVGKSTWEIYPPQRAQKYVREAEIIMGTRQQKFFEDFLWEGGKRHWFEVFISPVIDGNGCCIGTAGLARDITERREMQEQLIAADNAKSEFLAMMSHEIRTPMNSVLGYAQLLREMPLTPQQREYVDSINNSGKLLLAIINDILDFSKIEAGKVALQAETVPLRALFQRVLGMFEPLAAGKKLALHLAIAGEVPEQVRLDPHRLEQLLVNLLSNALKFTDAGFVELRVSAEEERRTVDGLIWRLRLEVTDTGIGIASQQMERLFRPFSQLESNAARGLTGTGLGLVIVEHLCKLMGGEIRVKSQPGAGSTFTAILRAAAPRLEAKGEPEPAPSPMPLGLAGRRVLVVEDNLVNRRLAAAILGRWDLQVDLVESGIQALEQIRHTIYDAVLMDVQMPGMDGLETTRLIRQWEAANPERPRLFIAALTAFARADDSQRCLAAGMDDYLSKPLNPEALKQLLSQALRAK